MRGSLHEEGPPHLLSRLECALELVGKGSEAFGRRLRLALGVPANVVLRQIRGNDSNANAFFLEVDAQDLDSYREADATDVFQSSDRPVGANVDTCANASMPGASSTKAPNSVTRVTRPVST